MSSLRQYRHPGDLPGHAYAGPVSLSGSGGRPIQSWRDMPFQSTTSPGTKNRTRERIQAHKDRIHILKAHHHQLRQRKVVEGAAKELRQIEKEINKLTGRVKKNTGKLQRK